MSNTALQIKQRKVTNNIKQQADCDFDSTYDGLSPSKSSQKTKKSILKNFTVKLKIQKNYCKNQMLSHTLMADNLQKYPQEYPTLQQ